MVTFIWCFNPRSRTGSDLLRRRAEQRLVDVSIHAPARGATRRPAAAAVGIDVSIHAPARGATRHLRRLPSRERVSIHAPARGATSFLVVKCLQNHVSIHAPARGATPDTPPPIDFAQFRSTLPHGERRRAPGGARLRAPSFNPRSRTGSDLTIMVQELRPATCFNPRSRTGSDPNRKCRCHACHVSIHAPARGATCLSYSRERFA